MNTNQESPHRRYNPLLDEWVLVSPHRFKRPWQGQQEQTDCAEPISYDETCYLCPGNTRVNGTVNDAYEKTFVFKNDFSALNDELYSADDNCGLFQAQSVQGESRVLCFSPDHSKSMALLSAKDIKNVIDTWQAQAIELGGKYKWVQIFENKGSVMGCSNPHPHGQIWAQSEIPSIPARKSKQLQRYWKSHSRPLLLDYVKSELKKCERIVCNNKYWVALVPYWAQWPFEVMLIPRFDVQHMHQLNTIQKEALASLFSEVAIRYDNLFQTSFPYSMGWHGAPFDGKGHAEWTLHASFFPPLLRSASVKKFMVGYEMLADAQRDMTPEQAAKMLTAVSNIHYTKKNNEK